ncbi:MAG TPA: hypothetical protein VFF06_33265 [Polyangia bacterium]|nr:hypothetical protein [Polyangia bacterium]
MVGTHSIARLTLILAGLLGGCSSRGSLVVVTVEATPPLSNVSRVHTKAVVGTISREFDVPVNPPSPTPLIFGIDLPPDLNGTISVHAVCFDANGQIGAGDGSGAIQVGGRSDVTVLIGGTAVDGGTDLTTLDLAASDLASEDLAAEDLAGVDLAGLDFSSPPSDLSGPFVWTPATVTGDFWGVWARPGDVYAVGSAGLIIHSTGDGTWSTPRTSGTTNRLRCVWGDPASGDIYVGGELNTLLHSTDGVTWTQEVLSTPLDTINAIWGSSKSDLYAVGTHVGGEIVHSTGGGVWSTPQGTSPNPTAFFDGVGGSSSSNLFAAGGRVIYRSTGNTNWAVDYTDAATNLNFFWVYAADATNIYVVGDHGIFYSTANGSWSNQLPGTLWESVWASSPTDIFAVGAGGTIKHSTGTAGSWADQNSGVIGLLRSVYGTSASDVYAVGAQNSIVHGHR